MTTIAEVPVRSRTDDQQWLAEIRCIVADLFRPSATVYWIDFLVTLAVGYPALLAFAHLPGISWQRGVCYVLAVIALFRAGSFIHEVAHFRQHDLRSFRLGWNLLFGVPFLMPSFFYMSHLGHHNIHRFGTADDGEYLPLASGRWGPLLEYLLLVPLMPLWIIARFLLSPLTFIHPRVRKWVLKHASSFVINIRASSTLPRHVSLKECAALELACSAVSWSLVLGLIFNWPLLVHPAFAVMVVLGALSLNYLRTLVAHRYRSNGREFSLLEQLDDSINVEGHSIVTEIVFPVGLRYHALHHLFPSIPYHNLGIAHRRLMAQLPADSPYRRTVFPSTWSALKCLWRDFRAAQCTTDFQTVPVE